MGRSTRLVRTAAIVAAALLLVAPETWCQTNNTTPGFAKGKAETFTYTENFDCTDEPTFDLNFNSIPAAIDPSEMQVPICQIGGTNQPTIDPTGAKIKTTDKLWVLVPAFSNTPDTDDTTAIPCPANLPFPNEVCGKALGDFFISGPAATAFGGSIPDGFRNTANLDSGITTQCPGPNDPQGSCTMHGDVIDLGPTLVALGILPGPVANVFVPIPNHSHVIDTSINHKNAIWWQIIVDLVFDPSAWPNASGSTGITSLKALRTAQATTFGSGFQASGDVPTNFFLFFGAQKNKVAKGAMAGMPGM